jgi:ATP-dependent DNA ligase
MLQRLARRLALLKTPICPFDDNAVPQREVHWVQPKLVAEVGFTEWTAEGKLRHPRFLGLRDDKKPKDVVREG